MAEPAREERLARIGDGLRRIGQGGEHPAIATGAAAADELQSLEVEARRAVSEALEHEPIQRDSSRLLLAAQAAHMALMGGVTRRWQSLMDRTEAAIRASGQEPPHAPQAQDIAGPVAKLLSDELVKAVREGVAEVVAAAREERSEQQAALEAAVRQLVRKELMMWPRALDKRTATQAGLGVAAALVVGAFIRGWFL